MTGEVPRASGVQVVVIGHATLDDRFDSDRRVATRQPGGASIYAAIGAAIWGCRVGIVTLVGPDYPETVLSELAAHDINLTGIRRMATPTISGSLHYAAGDERNETDLDLGYMPRMSPTPADIPSEFLEVTHIHLASMGLRQQLEHAERLAPRRATITLDTAAHYFGAENALLPSLLEHVTLFCPSVADLNAYFGLSASPPDWFPYLQRLDLKQAVIKMGSRGALVFSESHGRPVLVPAYPTSAVDPTGAGDSFCGGLLASLARGEDLLLAAAHGAVSASFVVETAGAWFPKFSEVERAARLESVRRRMSA